MASRLMARGKKLYFSIYPTFYAPVASFRRKQAKEVMARMTVVSDWPLHSGEVSGPDSVSDRVFSVVLTIDFDSIQYNLILI